MPITQLLQFVNYARRAGTFAGALALAVLIWVGGPLLGFGAAHPLASVWVRVVLIALIFGVLAAMAGWRLYKRREAARKLEQGIAGAASNESDARILSDRMKDALATLKKAAGPRGDYLYDLPWYVIIGPPGAGKTTALLNSGLKFPLARTDSKAYVEGVGGTRYCDWWFTEDAILIDTAGRYTTQDSGGTGDRQSWISFLDLLRKNRPRQPINGVLLAISLRDLLMSSPAEIQTQADAIRSRLLELHERLKINLPVYAVFTMADLVAGFREYFSDLREVDRRMVWGATFQTDDRTRNMIGEVPAEFDALIERLNQRLPDRLQEELNHTARVLLFGFSTQMMSLRRPLINFLNGIFEPTRYHANAMLRGFYFTSATQQGTPIDHLIGEMLRTFASDDKHLAYSGLGKSFFLTDLLTKVIFGEAGWVSTNRAATRRALVARSAFYLAIAIFAAVIIGLWSVSFVENRRLIVEANAAVERYQTSAGPLLKRTTIGEYNLGNVLDVVLTPLRNKIPPGYDHRNASVPRRETWGLSQRERLISALTSAYQRVLERTFRPRLLFRLEEQMKEHMDDADYIYGALKAYMMLGGLHRSDDALILDWMRTDWAADLYPGARYALGRRLLEQQLRSMLELDVGQRPIVELNGPVIAEAQKTLARMTLADRAYLLLRSEARASGLRDWSALERGGPDVADVFETPDEGLDALRVPGFFTYDGFHEGFLNRVKDVEKRLSNDHWVLGELGEQPAVAGQYNRLSRDLQARYNDEFIRTWTSILGQLRLRPMATGRPTYTALFRASAPTSPIRLILQSVREETALDIERPPEPTVEGADDAAPPKEASADVEGSSGFTTPAEAGITSDKEIALYFTPLNNLVAGEPGSQPIDSFLSEFADLHTKLQTASQAERPEQGAAEILDQAIKLKARAEELPKPASTWMIQATDDIAAEVAESSVSQLSQLYDQEVGKACTAMLANRYPFSQNSTQEVLMKDFSTMFQPGGVFDKFLSEHLDRLIDKNGEIWGWRQGSRLTERLSPDSLLQFQRASDIRDTFFGSSSAPSVSFTATPTARSPDVVQARLKINSTVISADPGVNTSIPVEWPGPDSDDHAAIMVQGTTFSPETPGAIVEERGPWGFFRLLDRSSRQRSGDSLLATFNVRGAQVTFAFNANSVRSPFFSASLREFRCPAEL